MPIKKRVSIPKPAPRPVKEPSDLMGNGYKNLVPLESVLKEHNQKASDLRWEGKDDEAEFHEDEAARIRQRIAEGEVWEPLH